MIEKIARICWNSEEWTKPSGREGKSLSKDSYENILGFGHEEWILDESKVLPNGYHYGFLQPMNVKSEIHKSQTYDIHLFTISPQKDKIYIGCLRNAKGVTEDESQKVYHYYKSQGWLDDMRQQIVAVNCKVQDLTPSSMFNVKFKFKDAQIEFNRPIIRKESIGHRYNLMNKNGEFEFEIDREGNIATLDTSPFLRITKGSEVTIDPLHKKIQNAVVKFLNDEYVKIYVEASVDGTGKQRIDIKGTHKASGEVHYFEVKTYSAKRSIREALGQVLEYTHYPNKNRAKKIFIIGPKEPEENDKDYMDFLRKTYKLPIWYRWYSFLENKLYDAI